MAIPILNELRGHFESILRAHCLGPGSSRIRVEIFELPDEGDALGPGCDVGLLGVAWREGDPSCGLTIMTTSISAYARALVDCEGQGSTVPTHFVEGVDLNLAQLKLLWPFIIGRFPPLQALAAAESAP